MKEIEIKLSYDNLLILESKLKSLGAVLIKNKEIDDFYFSNKSVSMAEAKSFIRIREDGSSNELTFKGEIESEGDIWERAEINVKIDSSNNMRKILEILNFKEIFHNKTKRVYWKIDNLEIVIVNILEPALVNYLEIEGPSKEKIESFLVNLSGIVKPLTPDHFFKLDEARKLKRS